MRAGQSIMNGLLWDERLDSDMPGYVAKAKPLIETWLPRHVTLILIAARAMKLRARSRDTAPMYGRSAARAHPLYR